jgi:hypothetical protein|tara:strand:- start:2292 stop:2930 length:639 start_codon:yes stop_codon:yes gene_type:complete
MGSCFKKKKSSHSGIKKTKGAKGSSGYVSLDRIASAKKNSAIDDLKMDLGIKEKNTAYYRDLGKRQKASQKALADMKARRKKRRGRVTDNDTTTTTTTTSTTTVNPEVGSTSVTPEDIYTRDPDDAMAEQELLAAEELRRQRIKRARTKQSLLRKRLERSQEVGSGRRVLSGTERDLNVQTRQAGSGRRGGAGRRSLITGSTGGIGYYSRFL